MTEAPKKKFFTLNFDFGVFLSLGAALYLAYTAHQTNLQNIDKVNSLLNKYEQTLDAAIANDKVLINRYHQNMQKAVNSLSPEEKKLMIKLLDVSTAQK